MQKRELTFIILFAWLSLTFVAGTSAQTALPKEENKREADLIELIKLDKTIKLDVRYARADNFVGKPVYTEARAFMQRPAADAIVRVHQKLKEKNLGLVIFDGYRPWSVTKLFWEVVEKDQRKFVANPEKGSKHNRGCAVDLSIYDLTTGELLEMPSDFDNFTEKASPDYKGGTAEQRENRDLLRALMEAEGFTVNSNEWWHFDYKDWDKYAIYDVAFSDIRNFDLIKNFRIGRVEFSGNKLTRDRIIRKASSLKEGDLFLIENLRKSIKNINELDLFEKIDEQNISWFTDKNSKDVDFIFYLNERQSAKTAIDK